MGGSNRQAAYARARPISCSVGACERPIPVDLVTLAWVARVSKTLSADAVLITASPSNPARSPWASAHAIPRSSSPGLIRRRLNLADVNGISTRKVDRLVEQLGIGGITKDRVAGTNGR